MNIIVNRIRGLISNRHNKLEALLCVVTCDKCGAQMKKGQEVLVIADGAIAKADELLTFSGNHVRYACHLDCWEGVDEDEIF